jgi:hypothetical protein
MVVELGPIAAVLGWVPGTPRVEHAAYAVARLLEVTDVATLTDMLAVETVARLCIWRAAEGALSAAYDDTTDGQTLRRSQMWDHAGKMVVRYEDECARLGIDTASGSGVVTISPVVRSEDPYALPAATGAEF